MRPDEGPSLPEGVKALERGLCHRGVIRALSERRVWSLDLDGRWSSVDVGMAPAAIVPWGEGVLVFGRPDPPGPNEVAVVGPGGAVRRSKLDLPRDVRATWAGDGFLFLAEADPRPGIAAARGSPRS